MEQEKKERIRRESFTKGSNITKGIVKSYVEIWDETEQPLIRMATIHTMNRKKH